MSEIPMNAQVNCSDGAAGTSTAVIIDPLSKSVTHVVVKVTDHDERSVPLKYIAETDHDSITLDCSKKELELMPQFKEFRYVKGVPNYPEFQGGEWEPPYVTLDYGGEMAEVEVVPAGELAVHRGDPVKATDGQVGIVDELVVEAGSGHISHLVLQKGHLWGKREVTVGVDLIDKVEDGTVYLSINKDAVKDLPSVKVKRHNRGQ